MVRYWAYTAVEELRLLAEEIAIISRRPPPGPTPSEGSSATQTRTPTTAPAHVRPPLLITRDKIRATVFGAGYPSVPTMTLDQFYELQVKCVWRLIAIHLDFLWMCTQLEMALT